MLIDGRTVYSPLFAGVFWDAHDLVLEDIDRIEVISDPGGTLWGANAVNGIINVTTKSAAATQGLLGMATRSRDGGQQAARWGGRIGADGHLRVYGLSIDRGASRLESGTMAPSPRWAALSRTVRAPARIDREFFFPGNPPFVIGGGPDFESEVARVLELGHRGGIGRNLTYSATLFRQNYSGLRGGLGFPARIANRIEGNVDGIEAWGQWQPADVARISLGWLHLRKDLAFSAPPTDAGRIPSLGNDPRNQWKLRAQFDLPHRTELDVDVRHIGALPEPDVPSYTQTDLRLGWQLAPQVAAPAAARASACSWCAASRRCTAAASPPAAKAPTRAAPSPSACSSCRAPRRRRRAALPTPIPERPT